MAHHLRLKLYFTGDKLAANEHVYPLQERQIQKDWIVAAINVLKGQDVTEFQFISNPPQVRFNWLSDFAGFLEALQEIERRVAKPYPPADTAQFDLTKFDVSGQKPS